MKTRRALSRTPKRQTKRTPQRTPEAIAKKAAKTAAVLSALPADYTGPVILRDAAVEAITGLERTTRYRLAKEGKFPRTVKLGGNSTGVLKSELDAWMAERLAARGARDRAGRHVVEQEAVS